MMHRYMVSIGGPGVELHTKDGVVCALVALTDEEKDKISPRDLINVVLNRAGIKVEEVSTPDMPVKTAAPPVSTTAVAGRCNARTAADLAD